jgi:hypothetical protein
MLVGLGSVVAVAAALIVLAGGGRERPLTLEEYREELVAAVGEFDFDASPRDPQALRQAVGEFEELVDELTGFVPPPEVAATHARLVSGLNDYARMLDRLADAGRAGVVQFHLRLTELGGLANHEWVRALNELAAQGYVTYEVP